MLLADIMAVFSERGQEAIPVVSRYPVIGYSPSFYPLLQFQRRLQVPFPPYKRRYFPRIPMLGINKPYFVLFLPHIGPEFVYFQAVIMVLLRLYLVVC
jgi:hypothetical protein